MTDEFTPEQIAVLAVANALAESAKDLAQNTFKMRHTLPPNYRMGYVHALQDLLDEVGNVIPEGWPA